MRLAPRLSRQLAKVGYDLRRPLERRDPTLDESTLDTLNAVKPYTMTSTERLLAACDAVRYVSRNDISGAVVECGVWAGGTTMAMARTLLALDDPRDLWLYDTFEGMSEPTADDKDRDGVDAASAMANMDEPWCFSPLDSVQRNIWSTGYPRDHLRFVKGKVEDTIPGEMPGKIAVLRLDTDWYESTAHELRHLLPLVVDRGVLLIDDYGHWQGARRAVDEWMAACEFPVLLSRTDYTGRMAIINRR